MGHSIGRIAPTPSGYLHAGNAVNFLLTSWLVRGRPGAHLALRIDDYDSARIRQGYLDDIFHTLDWLGITWDSGPGSPDDFTRNHALRHRIEGYRHGLASVLTGGTAYVCRCSRRDLAGHTGPGCPRSCDGRDLPLITGETAVRLRLPRDGTGRVSVDGVVVDTAAEFGDPIIWRRDGEPAYQFASVIDDRDLGADVLVRGMDLLPSTALQLLIAPMVDAVTLLSAELIHHMLLTGPDGGKLSKSAGAHGGPALRAVPGERGRIVAAARSIAAEHGIDPLE